MLSSATEEVIKRIGKHLLAKMDDLEDVLYEFPDANLDINYPSLSITESGKSEWIPEMNPVPYNPVTNVEDHKSKILYVVGQYNTGLQLDLWCRNKEERDNLYEQFFDAFHTQFPERLGLTLNLSEYHDIRCSYDMTGYSKEDSEISSQRKEWRVRIDIITNYKAIRSKEEFIVETARVGTNEEVREVLETQEPGSQELESLNIDFTDKPI